MRPPTFRKYKVVPIMPSLQLSSELLQQIHDFAPNLGKTAGRRSFGDDESRLDTTNNSPIPPPEGELAGSDACLLDYPRSRREGLPIASSLEETLVAEFNRLSRKAVDGLDYQVVPN